MVSDAILNFTDIGLLPRTMGFAVWLSVVAVLEGAASSMGGAMAADGGRASSVRDGSAEATATDTEGRVSSSYRYPNDVSELSMSPAVAFQLPLGSKNHDVRPHAESRAGRRREPDFIQAVHSRSRLTW